MKPQPHVVKPQGLKVRMSVADSNTKEGATGSGPLEEGPAREMGSSSRETFAPIDYVGVGVEAGSIATSGDPLNGRDAGEVSKQVAERVEEATTNSTGLNYPKAKCRRCEAMDSSAKGLAAPWCRRCGTFVESLFPCFYGGRPLVVKGVEEIENAETNSKY
ncbi:hypothetical protein B296_00003956 [Ensete ventricosum]|uniref:Uncharacterized protein n=1 Tax=Ensete ventricosum TaxID=4639 RepID=A0A427B5I8_ENSVE|nr:hypothetical protein B296_00003956 [Ensete ventricosum]